jgi:phage terminase small subunit
VAPLNHKQKRFALEFRVDHNATQAALRAGYSPRGAETQGMRLLRNAEVKKLIDAHDEKVLAKVEEKGNRVLEELALIGYFDPLGVFIDDPDRPDNGTLRALKAMPPEVRRNIKSLKFTELFEGASGEKFVTGRIVDITFWDKVKSLELLGKNQKLFTDKTELTADESLLDLLMEARRPGGDEE